MITKVDLGRVTDGPHGLEFEELGREQHTVRLGLTLRFVLKKGQKKGVCSRNPTTWYISRGRLGCDMWEKHTVDETCLRSIHLGVCLRILLCEVHLILRWWGGGWGRGGGVGGGVEVGGWGVG